MAAGQSGLTVGASGVTPRPPSHQDDEGEQAQSPRDQSQRAVGDRKLDCAQQAPPPVNTKRNHSGEKAPGFRPQCHMPHSRATPKTSNCGEEVGVCGGGDERNAQRNDPAGEPDLARDSESWLFPQDGRRCFSGPMSFIRHVMPDPSHAERQLWHDPDSHRTVGQTGE